MSPKPTRPEVSSHLAAIFAIAQPLLVEGEALKLDAIAVAYAKTGETRAADWVEYTYPMLIDSLREAGQPVVPVTKHFISHVENGTAPTTDIERARCIAGIGYASKTVAIYLPEQGKDDLFFIQHAIQRLLAKNTRPVERDSNNAALSNGAAKTVEAHNPTPVHIKRAPRRVSGGTQHP